VAGRRVGTGHGEPAAIAGTACGEREAVAEGCTASGGLRGHGMRRARATIAEGGAANLRGRRGELAASAVCVHGQRREQRGERAAVAGTECGPHARLVRRSGRRAQGMGVAGAMTMGLLERRAVGEDMR
jgi:hypothetical protein